VSALPQAPLVEETLTEPVGRPRWAPDPSHPDEAHVRTAPVRRPVSARQRAVYRRRRIVAAALLLLLIALVVVGVRGLTALVSSLVSGPTAAPVHEAAPDDPVQVAMRAGGSGLPLSPVGVDGRGVVDPPEGEAVWYAGGDRVRPGALGTAVIVGDVAAGDGTPTSFAEVTSLTEGDRVVVTFGDGVTLELDVVSASLVDRRQLESSDLVWGDQADTRRIALVTSEEVTDGDDRGTFLAVAELG